MTDTEWAQLRPLLPVPGWSRGRGGLPEAYCHRATLDAIRYLVDNRSQSVKADAVVGVDSRGFDGGKLSSSRASHSCTGSAGYASAGRYATTSTKPSSAWPAASSAGDD
ncbi:transposase [Streptomyces sp. NPDC059837]|uniref:transposase n=1 Tax=Streptomyces sp. NPDC059837 TaxID=3346968 RepID=UPI00364C2952